VGEERKLLKTGRADRPSYRWWGGALWAAVLVYAAIAAAQAQGANIHAFGASFGGASSTVVDPFPLGAPADVAIDQSSGASHGDFYVSDSGHFRVEKFDAQGKFVLMFGKEVNKTKVEAKASEAEQNVCTAASGNECKSGVQGAAGKGQFSNPRFVAVDSSNSASTGDVYVGDSATSTVYKFDQSGAFISENDGSAATGGPFSEIDGVTVDGSGNVWVFDAGAVFHFEENGTQVGTPFGTDGGRPSGIAVDGDEDFYVVQGLEDLAKFNSSGTLIGRVTQSPAGPGGGQLPTGFALNHSTEEIYVGFGTEIAHIAPGCDPAKGLCAVADSFGFPQLQAGAGLTASSESNIVYAADKAANLVDSFVVGLEAVTGSASEIEAEEATVGATVNPEGATVSECGFEYGATEEYGQSVLCGQSVGSGASPVSVSAQLKGLKGGTVYHYRVFARNSAGILRAEDKTFTTSPTAVIEEATAKNITATSAELTAKINPSGLDTHYRFEYGTTLSYSTSVPIPDEDIGSGSAGVEVSQAIGGLQPNTTYHFRVVASDSNAIVEGEDHTFIFSSAEHPACPNESLRAGLAANLPDCRGYEMVTPPQKNSALIGALLFGVGEPQISQDGSRMIVPSLQCFSGAESCIAHRQSEGELYEFSRVSGAWQVNPLAPPADRFRTESLLSWGANANSMLFSSPGADETETFYAREPDGNYRLIGPLGEPGTPYNALSPAVVASTSDYSHIVYETTHPVWSFDKGSRQGPGATSLYEYTSASSAEPQLVGVSGGAGSTDLISTCGTGVGASAPTSASNSFNPISEDGRIVYFTPAPCEAGGSGANAGKAVPVSTLYERVDESRTIAVSAAVAASCTTPECQGSAPAAALFEGASQSGERAVFTSTQQLTDGANQDRRPEDGSLGCLKTAPAASGCNLYLSECPAHCEDPSQRKLIDASEGAKSGGGPRVQGVVAISPDASHVYFVAKGALTNTKNKLGEGAQTGADNLYLYERDEAHPQGQLSFVARLSVEDLPNWAGGINFSGGGGEVSRKGLGVANVTPDGRRLVFASHRALTADAAAAGPAQIYRYDAQSEEMTRISVGQGGFNDNGNAGKAGADASIAFARRAFILGNGPAHTNPTMSNDGNYVFFQSPLALAPGALNEAKIGNTSEFAQNVYEFHEGVVSLISDGKDKSESGKIDVQNPELLGTDASGQNVFFATNSQLTGKDTDTQRDYYDARIGGGEEPAVEPPVCESDTCRGPSSVAPPSLPSTLVGPSGNLSPPIVPPPGPGSKPKPPSKAEQLAKALKSCRNKYKGKSKVKKNKRSKCEAQAKAKYAPKHKAAKKKSTKKKSKKSSKGSK
jgi:hypothetical protein